MTQCNMSDPPLNAPPEDAPKPREPSNESAMTAPAGLGLSRAQVEELIGAMQRMIVVVGCPAHIPLLDVVHDAFVMALCKPISKRPPISDWNRYVAWMCTLAKYAALTNRNVDKRRDETYELSEEEIAELLSAPDETGDPLVRDALRKAFVKLGPKDQEILNAHYREDKTIIEIAREKKLKWSVIDERRRRALDRLYALLQAILAAIILLVPKNARAHVARLTQRMARRIPQATQTACAMTVTVACGVLVPASSTPTVVLQEASIAMPSASPTSTGATAMMPAEVAPEELRVAPVKPIAVDVPAEQCSSAAMKSTKIASYLQGTVLPFAFLVAPAMTPLACAGGERQTPPAQQPDDEEEEDGADRYDLYCDGQRRLGVDCPSKEAWCAEMGMRPSPKGCK